MIKEKPKKDMRYFNTFSNKSTINDVIRLQAKGRDLSFIMAYTGLTSSKIVQIIDDYKKVEK